jgi:hypothetical protein
MASYYLKWGEERLEDKYYADAQKQSIDVQKDILGDDGVDALADKTTTLKAMNPFETDDLPIASATMNLSNQHTRDTKKNTIRFVWRKSNQKKHCYKCCVSCT